MASPEQTTLLERTGEPSAPRVARVTRTAAGVVLVVTGTALLFLPGPGWLVIAAGVSLLRRGRRRADAERAPTNAVPVGA